MGRFNLDTRCESAHSEIPMRSDEEILTSPYCAHTRQDCVLLLLQPAELQIGFDLSNLEWNATVAVAS